MISDTYDQYARPESRRTAGNAVTALSYDDASRLATIDYQFTDANDLTLGFEYNPAGQITRLTHSTDRYRYFGNDNKTGVYVVNGLNQYQSVNGQSYQYDANGNLTDDGPNTYTYDAENRLISVSGPGLSATLSYDPVGRLYRYTVGGQTTEFLYDGDSLIAEYQGSTLNKRYVHSTRVDTPLVQYLGAAVGAGNRQFLHKNHQGSVIAISDNSGNVTAANTYDAYGVPESGNEGRFGYTGQLWLKEIGLYYYKARMYSPVLGRFMQTDPVGYADQINMYAYVGNDPLNSTDPTGMVRDWLALGRNAIGFVGGAAGFTLGMTEFGSGVIALAAPEPTTLSKAGGVGLIVLGTGTMGVSMDSMRQNVNKMMSNILETDLSSPGLKEDIINPDNPVANGLYDATALATGLTSGGADKLMNLPAAVNAVTDIDTALGAAESINDSATTIKKSLDSEKGMSGGNVHICSGMGAEKGGCSN